VFFYLLSRQQQSGSGQVFEFPGDEGGEKGFLAESAENAEKSERILCNLDATPLIVLKSPRRNAPRRKSA
jgi:hypothetical protein